MDCVSGSEKNDPTLHQLIDEAVEDLMKLSDAELMAELAEEGADPEAEAQAARNAIGAGIARAGRARLVAARTAVDRDRTARFVRSPVPVAMRASILERFANDDPKLKSRLTMAARKGEGITEQEMDSILADLRELGVIDDEGNPIER